MGEYQYQKLLMLKTIFVTVIANDNPIRQTEFRYQANEEVMVLGSDGQGFSGGSDRHCFYLCVFEIS